MGNYSKNSAHVKGLLYNNNGKWKYDVCLDYNDMGQEAWRDWNLWDRAKEALKNATDRGISGVTLRVIPLDWMLVVEEPWGETSHPIMVIGGKEYE